MKVKKGGSLDTFKVQLDFDDLYLDWTHTTKGLP